MKKIYSLLATIMVAGSTFAQSLSVTVEGKTVASGDVINLDYAEYPAKVIGPMKIYTLEPEILIVSDTKQDVTVTAIDDDVKDGKLGNCFGGGCLPADEKEGFKVSKTNSVEAGSTKAGIELVYGSTNPGADLQRSFKVEIANASTTIAFQVNYNIGTYASVEGVGVYDDKDAAIYSISGSQLDKNNIPSGLYIKGGKKYFKK